MGFVRSNIQLEEYLDLIEVKWSYVSDADYKNIYLKLDEIIDTKNYNSFSSDDAISELEKKLPFSGYIFSAPRTKHLFSIYGDGGSNAAFGYVVNDFNTIDREKLNEIECVIANEELSFACMLNHEWQALCPELFIEKNV